MTAPRHQPPAFLTFEDAVLLELNADASKATQEPPPTRSNVIHVSHLAPDVTHSDLKRLFLHQEPQLVDIQIVKDAITNQHAGYGNVIFESPEAAQQAIELLGGEGSQVVLGTHGFGVLSYSKVAPPSDLDKFHLYVGNIEEDLSESDISRYLERLWSRYVPPSEQSKDPVPPMGKVTIKIPRDALEPGHIGFCFVKFEIERVAKMLVRVYENLMEQDEQAVRLKGSCPVLKEIKARPPMTVEGEQALSQHEMHQWCNTTLCVMGLPDDVTESELRKLFGKFGKLASVKIAVMKHLAFIKYTRNVSALAAMTDLEGEYLRDRAIRLFWARSRASSHTGVDTIASMEQERAVRERQETEEWVESLQPVNNTSNSRKRGITCMNESEKSKWAADLVEKEGKSATIVLPRISPPPPPAAP